jgi:hypothetical protein
MMKRFIFLILPLLAFAPVCAAQVNVALLHQMVAQSESEHGRQQGASSKQILVTAGEDGNRAGMGKLQSTCQKITGRLNALNLAISAGQIGLQAAPIIDEIIQQQKAIFQLAARDPVLLSLAYGAEADLADRADQLANYLYGLLLSESVLNQMKASDRSILFAHVLSELRRMAGASKGLAASMQYAARRKLLSATNPFSDYIKADRRLIDAIIRDATSIKHY